jgi:membrane fusion protein (multidrug efflux system)
VGEIADLRIGAVVSRGLELARVVPEGGLQIVARYLPADAVGRIAPGQPGRLRLDGFPWTQYGSVAATVTAVAGEAREGRLRVELAVDPGGSARVPLEHGMSGQLEIEVERVSPFTLILRAAGKAFDPRRPAEEAR